MPISECLHPTEFDPLSGRTRWRNLDGSLYALSEVFTVGPNPARITDLAITSDPGPDGMYRTGDEIEVTATFGAPVAVGGQPRVKLRLGRDRGQRSSGRRPDRRRRRRWTWSRTPGRTSTSLGVTEGLNSTIHQGAPRQFTTGAEASGYALSSIGIKFFDIDHPSTAGEPPGRRR